MYTDPGYSTFNWRGEEGIQPRGTGGRAAATSSGGSSWEQQANLAAQQRQQREQIEAARRQKELQDAATRANQYSTATAGVGPSAYLQPPAADPKSLYQTSFSTSNPQLY